MTMMIINHADDDDNDDGNNVDVDNDKATDKYAWE